MPTTILLAIAGLLATCVFGLLAIKLAGKYRRRTELTFCEQDCISLFESIVQSIEGIEVSYEKKPITQNLVLLKGCIANTGNRDIDKSAVHKPLTIGVSPSFKWVRAEIVCSSEGVNATCNLQSENELTFSWDLLKPGEYLRFDALADSPAAEQSQEEVLSPGKILKQNMRFSHRISNIGSIKQEVLPIRPPDRFIIRSEPWVLLLPFVLIVWGLSGLSTQKPLGYEFVLNDGSKVLVSATPQGQAQLVLQEVKGAFRDVVEANELFAKYRATPAIVESKEGFYFLVYCGSIGLVFIAGVCFAQWRRVGRRRKMLRMLELLK